MIKLSDGQKIKFRWPLPTSESIETGIVLRPRPDSKYISIQVNTSSEHYYEWGMLQVYTVKEEDLIPLLIIPKCECGADSTNQPGHAYYCPANGE